MLAVSRGRMEMVELTLEAGAEINATDEVRHKRSTLTFYKTALLASVRNGRYFSYQWFVHLRLELCFRDFDTRWRSTPMYAVSYMYMCL